MAKKMYQKTTKNSDIKLPTLKEFGELLSDITKNSFLPTPEKPIIWYMDGFLFKNTGEQILIETSKGWLACEIDMEKRKITLI